MLRLPLVIRTSHSRIAPRARPEELVSAFRHAPGQGGCAEKTQDTGKDADCIGKPVLNVAEAARRQRGLQDFDDDSVRQQADGDTRDALPESEASGDRKRQIAQSVLRLVPELKGLRHRGGWNQGQHRDKRKAGKKNLWHVAKKSLHRDHVWIDVGPRGLAGAVQERAR